MKIFSDSLYIQEKVLTRGVEHRNDDAEQQRMTGHRPGKESLQLWKKAGSGQGNLKKLPMGTPES